MKELFPDARVLRMDRDTVGHKDAYREILSEIRRGDADILVGTQMIAKGHDLPGVTLVGIIDADIGLHVPDFRSSERAYQLLTQAGGRAGRGEDAGRVFIQTREPKHPTIVAAVTGRFKAFARYEIEFRRKLGYPPIGRLLRLIVSSNSKDEAIEASRVVRKAMDVFDEVKVLGPAPCAYERIRGRYRMHLLIKADSPKVISQIANSMRLWKHGVKGFKDFRLAIDVDPIDML
jgi:primosomal protein N' (replication factor Y)